MVGQERAKQSLRCLAVEPRIGGVLLCGEKGTAKVMGGLEGVRLVELPVSATEDILLGGVELEASVRTGRRTFQPGLLAVPTGRCFYADEVNLLPSALTAALLDTLETGVCRGERDGISHTCPACFALVGTMNPEEGTIRPQLLDRFRLYVAVTGEREPEARKEMVRRRLAFKEKPPPFAPSGLGGRSGGRGRRCSTSLRRCARPARQIGSWCWRRGGRWAWALTGACWTPAPPTGKSGPLRPRKRREKMTHDEASGGPVLPPQRRSLQQRFGPHARARDGRGTVRRLLALYARWGRELLLVVCLTLLSTGAALAVPYLLGRAVDCFLPWGGVERAALSVLLPTLAGAAAAQWLGNWGRRRWMEILSQRMVARIRRECFAKLGRLPLSYFDRHPHGDTMNRLVSDADSVSTVAAETVTQLLSSLLMVAGACWPSWRPSARCSP